MNFKNYCYLTIYVPQFLKWSENNTKKVKQCYFIETHRFRDYIDPDDESHTEERQLEFFNTYDNYKQELYDTKIEYKIIEADISINKLIKYNYLHKHNLIINYEYCEVYYNPIRYNWFKNLIIQNKIKNINWKKIFNHFNFLFFFNQKKNYYFASLYNNFFFLFEYYNIKWLK